MVLYPSKKPYRAKIILLVLSVLLLVSAHPSLAGFKVEGIIIEENVMPGESLDKEIQLYNVETDKALDIEINVLGFGQGLDGSIIPLKAEEDKGPCSARTYIEVSDDELRLEPEWDDEIDVKIQVPDDIGDGSKYAVIQLRIPAENKTEGVMLDWGVLVPVLLTNIDSNLIRSGEITRMDVEWPNATIIFSNNGNTHFKPRLDATIKDSEGRVRSSTPVETVLSILPGYDRLYTFSFDDTEEMEPGDYSLAVSARLDDGAILDRREVTFKIDSAQDVN